MKRIVALDPGGTTGWAYWQDTPIRTSNESPWDHFTAGQIGPEEHHEQLFAHLEFLHTSDYTIVCESFEFRQGQQRHNIRLDSKEYIGVVKLLGQQRNLPVVFQTAALGKGFVSDEKLKVMGLWIPGKQHARDALRHLIYYMVVKQHHKELIRSWKDLT